MGSFWSISRVLRPAALVSLFLLPDCRTRPDVPEGAEGAGGGRGGPGLVVDPADFDLANNLPLLERITKSAHGYFRFINIPFANEVCRRFRGRLDQLPPVNLHGDAHLEQYAVTEQGRGLTDFDDASSGPVVIDLVRFGVSLHLACRARGWTDAAPGIFAEFLRGYREALMDPETTAPEPAAVGRIKSGFRPDRARFFQWVRSISEPISQEERSKVEQALKPYVAAMVEDQPELGPRYFETEQIARPRIGIGSALDRKYILRVRGKTDDPLDDDVLELKEVRDLSGIECLAGAKRQDPFRILVAQARIADEPYRMLGYVRLDGSTFWIHAWVQNYEELDIEDSFQEPEEIRQAAYDVGVQLGKGHPKQIAAPLDAQLRRETIRFLDERGAELARTVEELTDETEAGFREFNKRVHPQ